MRGGDLQNKCCQDNAAVASCLRFTCQAHSHACFLTHPIKCGSSLLTQLPCLCSRHVPNCGVQDAGQGCQRGEDTARHTTTRHATGTSLFSVLSTAVASCVRAWGLSTSACMLVCVCACVVTPLHCLPCTLSFQTCHDYATA